VNENLSTINSVELFYLVLYERRLVERPWKKRALIIKGVLVQSRESVRSQTSVAYKAEKAC
jgi:hypothetical protein